MSPYPPSKHRDLEVVLASDKKRSCPEPKRFAVRFLVIELGLLLQANGIEKIHARLRNNSNFQFGVAVEVTELNAADISPKAALRNEGFR